MMQPDEINEIVPGYVRRMLQVGEAPEALKGRCEHVIEDLQKIDIDDLPALNGCSESFECILFSSPAGSVDDLIHNSSHLLPYLDPKGFLAVVIRYNGRRDHPVELLDKLLDQYNLMRYKLVTCRSDRPSDDWQAMVAVRKSYNPILHARELAERGDFNSSIQILRGIPHDLIQSHKNLALISAEKQRLYFEWQKSAPADHPRHMLYFRARKEFADVTNVLPLKHASYHTDAEFWHHIGNDNMSVRTLRSILHADYDALTERKLLNFTDNGSWSNNNEKAPEWSDLQRQPRLLIITHDFSDYGMDTLYDGLCRVLGKENVIEFPWKPTLHGCNPQKAGDYPCTFNYGDRQLPLDEILTDLDNNRFDLIIYADVVQMAYPDEIRLIMKKAKDLPAVLYDPYDNCYTPWKKTLDYTGRDTFDLYFKREMLAGVDYGANAFPLPFSFPEGLINGFHHADRSNAVFWAGKRVWGLRPLYIPSIEQILNRKFDKMFNQEEYRRALQSSRIGLSFFGSGFDTVRYWEIPAYGAMLLAERPPIRIPHNFIDGKSAVFFEDLPDLEAKLNHYLNHPDEAAQIAAAGSQILKRYHTSTARARQFLGYLEKHLAW